MLRVKPYTTFLDLPRGANIFWIALTGLTYETVDDKRKRKFKASSVRGLGRYVDDSLRIVVPRIFKPLEYYYIKYSKIFQRRISVNQLHTNVKNLNAIGALVKFENGTLGFVNMIPYPVIYFSDLSIKNINQIKSWYTAEIVYFTSAEKIMRNDIHITVLDGFSVNHKIAISSKGEYSCDICDKNCVGIQYVLELIDKHGYIADDADVLVRRMESDIPVPKPKLEKFITPSYKFISDRKVKSPKEFESVKQSDYLTGLADVLNIDDETLIDLIDNKELGYNLEQAQHFNYPREGCTGDLEQFEEIVETVKSTENDSFIELSAEDIMYLTDIPMLHKDESLGLLDLKSMREYTKIDGELLTVERAHEIIDKDFDPEEDTFDGVLAMDGEDITELIIHMTGLRIANTLEIGNEDQFVEEFKSHVFNLDITELIELLVNGVGGYQVIQKRLDKFIDGTSLYLAIKPDTLATLYLNDETIENTNIIDGVQPGYNLQRLAVESNKMHITIEDYSELPKYGFLSTKNFVRPGRAGSYGQIILEFNDSIKRKSSACIKDSFASFNPDFQLSKHSDYGGDVSNLILGIVSLEYPDHLFFDTYDVSEFAKKIMCNMVSLSHFLARLKQDSTYGLDLQYLFGSRAEEYDYFEAHIPGVISLDDVKCIHVPNAMLARIYHLFNNIKRRNNNIPIKLYKATGIIMHGETPDLDERIGQIQ